MASASITVEWQQPPQHDADATTNATATAATERKSNDESNARFDVARRTDHSSDSTTTNPAATAATNLQLRRTYSAATTADAAAKVCP